MTAWWLGRLTSLASQLEEGEGRCPLGASRTDPEQTGAWRLAIERAEGLFEPLRHAEITHMRRLNREAFVSYIASLGLVALPCPNTSARPCSPR